MIGRGWAFAGMMLVEAMRGEAHGTVTKDTSMSASGAGVSPGEFEATVHLAGFACVHDSVDVDV